MSFLPESIRDRNLAQSANPIERSDAGTPPRSSQTKAEVWQTSYIDISNNVIRSAKTLY
jgi:hypothetical protein